MDAVWVRVVEELRRRGETAPQVWLATKLGLTEQAVANWKVRGIPKGRYMDIAQALGWPVEQLTSDGLPMKGGAVIPFSPMTGGEDSTLAYAGSHRSHTKVPVVGTAYPVENGYYSELEHKLGGDGLVEAYSTDAEAYAIEVKGDRLHPYASHGEFLIVEPKGSVRAGEKVVMNFHDGRTLIAELMTERPDSVTVISVSAGQRMTFDRVQIRLMHPVVGRMSASKWRPE